RAGEQAREQADLAGSVLLQPQAQRFQDRQHLVLRRVGAQAALGHAGLVYLGQGLPHTVAYREFRRRESPGAGGRRRRRAICGKGGSCHRMAQESTAWAARKAGCATKPSEIRRRLTKSQAIARRLPATTIPTEGPMQRVLSLSLAAKLSLMSLL